MLKAMKPVLLLAAIFVFGLAINANATAVLNLNDGVGHSVTVQDTDGDGIVSFVGTIGVFKVNVATGLTKPDLNGTPFFAQMDLQSGEQGGPGTLTVSLTDFNFPATESAGVLTLSVGGTTNGSVSFEVFKQVGDQKVADVKVGPIDPPGNDIAFQASASAEHGVLQSYTMGLIATVTHTNRTDLTTFNLNAVNAVPEPTSLLLLGTGLLGVGILARRRSK